MTGDGQAAVLRLLRHSPEPLAMEQIVEGVGLSRTTARFHLDHLLRRGLVERTAHHGPGRGRPGYVYRALAPEAVDPAASYRLLAGLLAAQVRSTDDVAEAGRRWAAVLPAELLAGASDPAEAATRLLLESGFRPTRDGEWISLGRCPFIELVSEHAEVVCGIHAALISAALEQAELPADVELQVRPEGHLPCRMRLTPGEPKWQLSR